MTGKTGFDNERYLAQQTEAILKRVERFNNKLYLEFGGKLLYDYHAAPVLPGDDPNVKMRLLQKLRERADVIHLLSPAIIDSIRNLKQNILGAKAVSLDVEEVLICLSINASANPTAQIALEKLTEIRGCEVHLTHIPTPGDEMGLRRLGVNLTSDPTFSSKNLFVH